MRHKERAKVNNSKKTTFVAQGTIEYLVIIAVVIVIALVVVALLLNQTSTGQQISTNTKQIGNTVGQGGISITDSLTSSNGDAVISLKNISGQNLTIQKVNPVNEQGELGKDNFCIKNLSTGQTNECILTNVNELCPCVEGKPTTCNYKITFTTNDGLEKTETFSINSICTPIHLYTVTFNAGLGGTIDGQKTYTEKVLPGKSTNKITATPSEGYDFNSWSDGTTNPTKTITNVNENKTINATFTPKTPEEPITFTITYDANEGINPPTDETNYESGTTVTILGQESMTKEGHTFLHWKNNSTGTTYNENDEFEITNNTTLYAQWEELDFYELNGTIYCPNAEVGDTGEVNGITYTKRTKEQITADNATTTCTSGIINMDEMFYGSQFNQDISNWDVSSVENMGYMFWDSKFNQDISNWDVSSVINISGMFGGSQFDQNISDWNVSSIENMGWMFAYSQFNQNISNWDVSSVINIDGMFYGSQFNQDISNWDVSSVTNMEYMFSHSTFNKDISDWNVISVTNMTRMFEEADSFYQDLSGWCVSKIPIKPYNFDAGASLYQGQTALQPQWGTCPQ